MEDNRQMAFNLFKAGVIDKESLLDLIEPPMKEELKSRLKRMEEKQAGQPPAPPSHKEKPELKKVG
jgi:hypothetical protein